MKLSLFGALAALSPLAALAAPLSTRAAAAEGPIGYASQNGGTTGGAIDLSGAGTGDNLAQTIILQVLAGLQ